MKEKRLVHPSHSRAVMSEAEADRLRALGWRELPDNKPMSRDASKHRRHREKCRVNGFRHVCVYLPSDVADGLLALRRDGETMAAMLTRLVKSQSLIG